MEGWKICWEEEGGKSGLSEGGVWWVGVWGGGGIDKVGVCKVIMGDEREGWVRLGGLFMVGRIECMGVYGFVFEGRKIR